MNEEELKALLAAKEEALTKAQNDLATAHAANASTVEELKELRQKKQEAEAQRDLASSELEKLKQANPGSAEEVVKKILEEKDKQTLDKVKTQALESFKQKHKELFGSDTDPAGIKFNAFQSKLSRLNLSDLTDENQFHDAYEDALILLRRSGHTDFQKVNIDPSMPLNNNQPPTPPNQNGLSSKEKKLIEQMGWTEERFLKIKKSKPSYMANLLSSFEIT